MTSATDAKGNVTNYTYNNKDQLTSVSQGGISVSYTYDSNNQLSTITHNGFTYNFIYDALGRSDKVQIGTRLLVDNMYEAETGLLQKSTYGNGDTREYEYDSKHRVTKLIIDNVDRFSYNYDNLGNLHSYTDLVQNITYTYLYDFLGRPVQVRTSSGFRIKLTYDEYNRASDVKFEFGSDALSTSWIYGKSSVVYGVKYNGTEKLSYTYDSLMRRSKTTINTTNPFVTTYGYKDISLDKTTTQLNSISYSNGKGFVYTYDANGNILTIKDQDNTLLANYTYDSLNQLTREDNAQLNKTITYTYDDGGNILSIKEYAFTTGELGSVTNEKTYTYGNTEWKDLLTNYNGTDISYDTIGNPLNWINGETFTWSGGRQLTGITKGNTNISYTYNDGNIRTSKTVNGVRTDYYLNGTTIIMQKTGDNCIWFTYDENNFLSGFRYNGSEYYYFRNAQSDIIGIIDSSGAIVANYTYDCWGNHIAITDSNGNDVSADENHIANINPFRYRGYYFDSETGLYYLNSRYYDATVGRFMNVDVIIGANGYGLFNYCGNNPIILSDPSGMIGAEGCLWIGEEQKIKEQITIGDEENTAHFSIKDCVDSLVNLINNFGEKAVYDAIAYNILDMYQSKHGKEFFANEKEVSFEVKQHVEGYFWAKDITTKMDLYTTTLMRGGPTKKSELLLPKHYKNPQVFTMYYYYSIIADNGARGKTLREFMIQKCEVVDILNYGSKAETIWFYSLH